MIHNYSVIIPQPHKPNYGTSQRKDEIIIAIEADIKVSMEEYYEDPDQFNDEWLKVDVYIADLYEYESGMHAWFSCQVGSISEYPVYYEEYDNKYEILTGKCYTISGVGNFNEYGNATPVS